MEEKEFFQKINDMLEPTDYPVKITSIADLDDFLLDDDNRRFDFYPVIGRMYDDFVGNPEIDRYEDVSVEKDEEQMKGPGY